MQARKHVNSDEFCPPPRSSHPVFFTYRKNPMCYNHTVWGKIRNRHCIHKDFGIGCSLDQWETVFLGEISLSFLAVDFFFLTIGRLFFWKNYFWAFWQRVISGPMVNCFSRRTLSELFGNGLTSGRLFFWENYFWVFCKWIFLGGQR